MKKNYVSPRADIIYTNVEDALLAGSPNNDGTGGDHTPGGGFSKSFDMGDEDWQNADIGNDWNF